MGLVVLTCFVMYGCCDNSVGVLVTCTCVYCVFVVSLCIFYSYLFVCNGVRTTATKGKLNCSK